jgi:ubiquinone biosynthesis accessory factor UbiJ
MFASSAIAGLNHLLADAPWARERLAPFAGRTAIFVLKPIELGLGIDKDGYFSEAATAEPDVSLELPLASLPKAIGGPDALMADIRISGNADLADALGFVLRKLRWDSEEALSRVIGDIAAHRALGIMKSIAGWHQQTAQNLVENLAEYFGEEQPVLVKHHTIEDFSRSTSTLRDDLARLEKRLRKLESRG